uniref:Protein kinase domain protein n=1 Tax=Megaviridae environmental sample TaxID=1737588 RepID=A0A5J6VJ24_9VIRU|nr:MAG: protein kinase domain protein [Megaviridae environmental sample]
MNYNTIINPAILSGGTIIDKPNSHLLGRGEYGSVYLYEHKNLSYAVKTALDDKGNAALELEARVLMELRHPNIIKAFRPIPRVLVMINCQRSLQQIEENDNINLKMITYQLLSAVTYINSLHIYHKDIKPDNVMLINDQVQLVDFGLAEYSPPNNAKMFDEGTDYTKSLLIRGITGCNDLYDMSKKKKASRTKTLNAKIAIVQLLTYIQKSKVKSVKDLLWMIDIHSTLSTIYLVAGRLHGYNVDDVMLMEFMFMQDRYTRITKHTLKLVKKLIPVFNRIDIPYKPLQYYIDERERHFEKNYPESLTWDDLFESIRDGIPFEDYVYRGIIRFAPQQKQLMKEFLDTSIYRLIKTYLKPQIKPIVNIIHRFCRSAKINIKSANKLIAERDYVNEQHFNKIRNMIDKMSNEYIEETYLHEN